MHLSDHEETTILVGAYLHDVGMIRVPAKILEKPGPLTPSEIAIVRQHTILGVELLAGVDFPWDIKPIIRWHHERLDGSGYPDHLKGDALPVSVQIVGIAEAYEALTMPRPFRAAMTLREAQDQIVSNRGRWSDHVVEAFTRVIG